MITQDFIAFKNSCESKDKLMDFMLEDYIELNSLIDNKNEEMNIEQIIESELRKHVYDMEAQTGDMYECLDDEVSTIAKLIAKALSNRSVLHSIIGRDHTPKYEVGYKFLHKSTDEKLEILIIHLTNDADKVLYKCSNGVYYSESEIEYHNYCHSR